MCGNCFHGQNESKSNPPPVLDDISRVTSVKILIVTMTNKLSVSDHVRHVMPHVRWEYCSVMARMTRPVYQAVVISRLFYAASAWWGFTTAADRQSIDAFIRRGIRAGFCDKNMPGVSDLSRTLTMRFSSGLWETNIMFCTIFFLTVKLNSSTIWDHAVMNLHWVKHLDTCQIVILLLDHFTKTVIDFTLL